MVTPENIVVGLGSLLVAHGLWRMAGAYRTRRAAASLVRGALGQRGRHGVSVAAVAKSVAAALRIQSRLTAGRLFIWGGKAHLLRAADDDWSIGYLHGFTLQALWRAGAAPGEANKGVDAVFRGVYGRERAEPLLVRLTNFECAQDPDYDVGYAAGMAECASWILSRGAEHPKRWAAHIMDFERGQEPIRL